MNKPPLVNQPTNKPSRKVVVGNSTGAGSTVIIMAFLVFAAETYYDPAEIPNRVQNILPFFGITIQGLITFICQYLMKNREGEV